VTVDLDDPAFLMTVYERWKKGEKLTHLARELGISPATLKSKLSKFEREFLGGGELSERTVESQAVKRPERDTLRKISELASSEAVSRTELFYNIGRFVYQSYWLDAAKYGITLEQYIRECRKLYHEYPRLVQAVYDTISYLIGIINRQNQIIRELLPRATPSYKLEVEMRALLELLDRLILCRLFGLKLNPKLIADIKAYLDRKYEEIKRMELEAKTYG